MLLDDAQFGDGHCARRADAPDVVADEVHDHHVLGVVLLQEVRLGASGALDRAGFDGPADAAEEEFGGGGGDLDAVHGQANRSCIRCRVALREQRGQRVHVGAGWDGRGQHPAEVRLIDLAGRRCARGSGAPPRCTRRGRGTTSSHRWPAPPLPGPLPRRGHRFLSYVPEAGAGQAALVVRAHGPETGGVEGGGVAGDIEETGGDEAAEAGERSEIGHTAESMAGVLRVP